MSDLEDAVERCLSTYHDQDYLDEIEADQDRQVETRVKFIVDGFYDEVPMM